MNQAPPQLPPIRAPLQRRWREFRIQVLPWIVFAGVVTVAGFLWKDALLPEPVAPPQANCEPKGSETFAPPTSRPLDAMPSGSAALTLSNGFNGAKGPRD
jgi:hypothetical protein